MTVVKRLVWRLAAAVILPVFLYTGGLLLRYLSPLEMPFPHPRDVFEAFPALTTLDFENRVLAYAALWTTIKRVLLATLVSLVTAVVFAFALSWWPRLWSLSQPTVDLFRSIPVTFFVPVAAVLSGPGKASLPWVLAAIPCSLIMLLQIRQGIIGIDKARIHAFYVLAGSKSPWNLLRYVVLQEIMPEVMAGIRLGCSYAIVIVSVLEYLAVGSQEPGFGLLVAQVAQNSPNDPKLIAGILTFGIIGYAMNKGLEILDTHLSKWRDDDVKS